MEQKRFLLSWCYCSYTEKGWKPECEPFTYSGLLHCLSCTIKSKKQCLSGKLIKCEPETPKTMPLKIAFSILPSSVNWTKPGLHNSPQTFQRSCIEHSFFWTHHFRPQVRIFTTQNFVFLPLNFSNWAKPHRSPQHSRQLIFLEGIFINSRLLQHSTISICSSLWFPKLYFIDSHNWKTEKHKSSLDKKPNPQFKQANKNSLHTKPHRICFPNSFPVLLPAGLYHLHFPTWAQNSVTLH